MNFDADKQEKKIIAGTKKSETIQNQILQNVYIGIDIGGTDTKIGLLNNIGEILAMSRFATLADRAFPDYVKNLKYKINTDLLSHHPDVQLKGIGIGAPNANYRTGKIEDASNLSWENVDVVSVLKEEYNVPVVITNDANAAAMGEKYFGAAKELDNFIVLTLGTGLGSGIMINRSIVYGAGGHAGEIGHMVVDPQGRQCGCGRRGCVETYVSASGIKRTVFELISEYTEPSRLRNISFDDLTAQGISNAAADNDPIALKAFERTGKILGMQLADVVALINPEVIILTGGLANAGNLLLKPVQRHLEKNLLSIFRGKTRVMLSQLVEGNLAILGAGALIMQHVKK